MPLYILKREFWANGPNDFRETSSEIHYLTISNMCFYQIILIIIIELTGIVDMELIDDALVAAAKHHHQLLNVHRSMAVPRPRLWPRRTRHALPFQQWTAADRLPGGRPIAAAAASRGRRVGRFRRRRRYCGGCHRHRCDGAALLDAGCDRSRMLKHSAGGNGVAGAGASVGVVMLMWRLMMMGIVVDSGCLA